jgi:hypothetical protein
LTFLTGRKRIFRFESRILFLAMIAFTKNDTVNKWMKYFVALPFVLVVNYLLYFTPHGTPADPARGLRFINNLIISKAPESYPASKGGRTILFYLQGIEKPILPTISPNTDHGGLMMLRVGDTVSISLDTAEYKSMHIYSPFDGAVQIYSLTKNGHEYLRNAK